MDFTRLAKPVIVDAGALGLATVGLVYVLTHSGALLLGTAGVGLVLVALGGGTGGQVPASGASFAENTGLGGMVDDMDVWPGASADVPVRARLLFYGCGLVVWSLAVLGAFRSSLH